MKKFLLLFSRILLFGIASQAQTNVPDCVPQNGLVGWWPFTGNANDQSGMNNTGIVSGAQLTTNRFGNANAAYNFNGVDNFIEVADAASLRVRKITIAAWVYSVNPDPNMIDQVVYKGRKSDAQAETFATHVTMESSIKINSYCQAGQGWQKTGNGGMKVSKGQWVHLCTTFDGNVMRNYINAEEVKKSFISGQIDSCVGSEMRFGCGHDKDNKAYSLPFMGKLDDIGIWNRALYLCEIRKIYEGQLSGIAEVHLSPLKMYPNPSQGSFSTERTIADVPLLIKVTDLTGRVISETPLIGTWVEIKALESVSRGLYFVTISDKRGIVVRNDKLIAN